MTLLRTFMPIIVTTFFISGCASVQLKDAQSDKVKVTVDWLENHQKTTLNVHILQGVGRRPVELSAGQAQATTTQAEVITLKPFEKRGVYGFQNIDSGALKSLQIDSLGTVTFPKMSAVTLPETTYEGQKFVSDDLLTLALTQTTAPSRFLVAETRCKNRTYRTEQMVTTQATDLKIKLNEILRKLNNRADANLLGNLPITLRIEERYQAEWPAPFVAKSLVSADEVHFFVDTVGFRFRANIGLNFGDNLFLNLASDERTDLFCH